MIKLCIMIFLFYIIQSITVSHQAKSSIIEEQQIIAFIFVISVFVMLIVGIIMFCKFIYQKCVRNQTNYNLPHYYQPNLASQNQPYNYPYHLYPNQIQAFSRRQASNNCHCHDHPNYPKQQYIPQIKQNSSPCKCRKQQQYITNQQYDFQYQKNPYITNSLQRSRISQKYPIYKSNPMESLQYRGPNHHNSQNHYQGPQKLFNVDDISFPLSTLGFNIVDRNGRKVKLAGGNWSGGHLVRQCVGGLQVRNLRQICIDIKTKLKFNCVRLNYSLEMYFSNKKVVEKYLTANPQLKSKTTMEIFDKTVETLTDVGIMVILNNHTSKSMWCCSGQDGDGLWWSKEYPEEKFFECAEGMARRYKNNPRVIGMDLRNQIRNVKQVQPTWGEGSDKTNWKRAAQICGNRVHQIAPDWLILVGCLNYNIDFKKTKQYPMKLNVPNKLIYTGHIYPWSIGLDWNKATYQQFRKIVEQLQTFVRTTHNVPFLLGQFGAGARSRYWQFVIQWMRQLDFDWTYWSIDGFKNSPNEDESYGLFERNYKDIRNIEKLNDLISVGPPAGTNIPYQSPPNYPPDLYQYL